MVRLKIRDETYSDALPTLEVWLRRSSTGSIDLMVAGDFSGDKCIATLREDGILDIWACAGAVAGLQTDENGRIKLGPGGG